MIPKQLPTPTPMLNSYYPWGEWNKNPAGGTLEKYASKARTHDRCRYSSATRSRRTGDKEGLESGGMPRGRGDVLYLRRRGQYGLPGSSSPWTLQTLFELMDNSHLALLYLAELLPIMTRPRRSLFPAH